MTKPAYMSQQLYDILCIELEHQQAIMRKHYCDAELHKAGLPGHDDSYQAFCEANDEAKLIRQQLGSIMRKETR